MFNDQALKSLFSALMTVDEFRPIEYVIQFENNSYSFKQNVLYTSENIELINKFDKTLQYFCNADVVNCKMTLNQFTCCRKNTAVSDYIIRPNSGESSTTKPKIEEVLAQALNTTANYIVNSTQYDKQIDEVLGLLKYKRVRVYDNVDYKHSDRTVFDTFVLFAYGNKLLAVLNTQTKLVSVI